MIKGKSMKVCVLLQIKIKIKSFTCLSINFGGGCRPKGERKISNGIDYKWSCGCKCSTYLVQHASDLSTFSSQYYCRGSLP